MICLEYHHKLSHKKSLISKVVFFWYFNSGLNHKCISIYQLSFTTGYFTFIYIIFLIIYYWSLNL